MRIQMITDCISVAYITVFYRVDVVIFMDTAARLSRMIISVMAIKSGTAK